MNDLYFFKSIIINWKPFSPTYSEMSSDIKQISADIKQILKLNGHIQRCNVKAQLEIYPTYYYINIIYLKYCFLNESLIYFSKRFSRFPF